MLTEDVTMTMPPRPTWYRGREAVAGFLREYPLAGDHRSRLVPAGVNAPDRVRALLLPARTLLPHGINVLTLRGDRIADITTFLDTP